MNNLLAVNFGRQLEELVLALKREWIWPSPGIGFAMHVFHTVGEPPPFHVGTLHLADSDRRRLDQAEVYPKSWTGKSGIKCGEQEQEKQH